MIGMVNSRLGDLGPYSGAGGVLPYMRYIGMCLLSRFGLKTGIDFEHFCLKLGMVIKGTFTKAYKLIFLPSNQC